MWIIAFLVIPISLVYDIYCKIRSVDIRCKWIGSMNSNWAHKRAHYLLFELLLFRQFNWTISLTTNDVPGLQEQLLWPGISLPKYARCRRELSHQLCFAWKCLRKISLGIFCFKMPFSVSWFRLQSRTSKGLKILRFTLKPKLNLLFLEFETDETSG